MLTRRAIGSASFDPKTRTATAVLASEHPVRRPWGRPDGHMGPWIEVLPVSTADLSRAAGASVLIDHVNRARERVGVIEAASVVGTEIHGRLKFSGRPEIAPLLEDIRELGSQISVGYQVEDWTGPDDPRADVPTFRAAAWTLLEASLVAVAADPTAKVRSHEGINMDDNTFTPAPAEATPEPTRGGGITLELPAAEQAERDRILRIQEAGRTLKLEAEAAEMVQRGIPADQACQSLLAAAAARDEANSIITSVRGGADYSDPAVVAQRMQAALLHRADPGRYSLPPEAVEFRGLSLVELRRTLLQAHGVNCRGWLPDKVLSFRHDGWMARAGGLMTTSDLPSLLTSTGQRILEDAYQMAASPLKLHSRERSANDFRSLTTLRAGNISPLSEVNEHGEVTRGQAAEAKESFRVRTYAKIWGFSRQAIINDDLGALTDWTQEMGAAAAETEASLFVSLLTANGGVGPTLDDGTALFDASRGNYQSSGTAISVESLSDAREAMRSQKGVGGVFPIGVSPVAILVSPANETAAERVVATLQPDQVANANPFSGRLRVEVEVRLTGFGWYLFAENPAFQHAYLNGRSGPQLETRDGWDVLGTEFRAVLDVGVHVRDFRFVYYNVGDDPFAT